MKERGEHKVGGKTKGRGGVARSEQEAGEEKSDLVVLVILAFLIIIPLQRKKYFRDLSPIHAFSLSTLDFGCAGKRGENLWIFDESLGPRAWSHFFGGCCASKAATRVENSRQNTCAIKYSVSAIHRCATSVPRTARARTLTRTHKHTRAHIHTH